MWSVIIMLARFLRIAESTLGVEISNFMFRGFQLYSFQSKNNLTHMSNREVSLEDEKSPRHIRPEFVSIRIL